MTIEEMRSKHFECYKRGDYVGAAKWTGLIKQAQSEQVTLKSIIDTMTEEERKESLLRMHMMFVFADILYGCSMDFEKYIQGKSGIAEIEACKQARRASEICRGITRNVDEPKDEKLSSDFGDMCDEIFEAAEKIIKGRMGI